MRRAACFITCSTSLAFLVPSYIVVPVLWASFRIYKFNRNSLLKRKCKILNRIKLKLLLRTQTQTQTRLLIKLDLPDLLVIWKSVSALRGRKKPVPHDFFGESREIVCISFLQAAQSLWYICRSCGFEFNSEFWRLNHQNKCMISFDTQILCHSDFSFCLQIPVSDTRHSDIYICTKKLISGKNM